VKRDFPDEIPTWCEWQPFFYSPLDLLVDTGGLDFIDADDFAATLISLRSIAVVA